ncbi:hypothetical protein HOD20_03985 [archaeon]|jgi:hypothetical protein|nr:hypothetical protein [Candidatus Woesearchaeota archaeon]MBT3464713.1 hypothetical protein [archaeon]MBT4351663.1 hypothetical protein [archaeon]MBT4647560.1 hypothetical protein [archaeon]MBT6821944.1 hypothetical protein [archaeon]
MEPSSLKKSIENIKLNLKFYEKIIDEKKQKNETLNKLLYERNKQIIEMNRRIEYLIQEQKYEIIEIIQSINKDNIDKELLRQLVEKYNSNLELADEYSHLINNEKKEDLEQFDIISNEDKNIAENERK